MNTFHPASGEATRPRTARRRRAVAALLGCTTLLAGCASIPTSPSWPMVSPEPDSELPAQARIYDAKDLEAVPYDDSPAYGSLPPNGASVKENVPNILKRGRLVVGVAQSLYRLGYRDPESSDLIGFEIDLAHEIARDIFGDPELVDFRFVESANRASALGNHEVDIIIRTMTVTGSRQQEVAFSSPYLTTDSRLLVMSNSAITGVAQLPGRTVCVTDDSTALEKARIHAPQSRILKTRSWADCLVALQQSQADAILSDDTILSGIAAQDPYTEIVGESLATESYAVAAARSDEHLNTDGLVRQVNATIERVRADGTWWRLYDRWFAVYLATSGPPPLMYRPEDAPQPPAPEEEAP